MDTHADNCVHSGARLPALRFEKVMVEVGSTSPLVAATALSHVTGEMMLDYLSRGQVGPSHNALDHPLALCPGAALPTVALPTLRR